MSKFIITGGKKLAGEIHSAGNKNAILPIMAATLLIPEECVLENVPRITDVISMGEILQDLGAQVTGIGTSRLIINTAPVTKTDLNPELVKKLRASILCMGPLLARFGKTSLRHPGGCVIGRRAVGTHFEAMEALGAVIKSEGESYDATVDKLHGASIFLDEASVTATENALMLACLAPGKTVIDDAAAEPHIDDLATFLNLAGAQITGSGTSRLTIDGVDRLKGVTFAISPDHIEVGTFAILAAATGSTIDIVGVKEAHLKMILLYLAKMGVNFTIDATRLAIKPSTLVAPNIKIQTRTWPGFPTDIMSPFIVLATQAQGATLCHDWMYETRMFFVDKLMAMGAKITICDPHRVLVVGPTSLRAKAVDSPDIRAGVSLIIAALCAEGESVIANAEIIERGYEDIVARLQAVGADIRKVE